MIVAAAPESRCTIPYGPPVTAICTLSSGGRPRDGCSASSVLSRRTLRCIQPGSSPTCRSPSIQQGTSTSPSAAQDPCARDCRVYHLLVAHGPGGRVLGHWGRDELDQTANWAAVTTGGRGNYLSRQRFQSSHREAGDRRTRARTLVNRNALPQPAGMWPTSARLSGKILIAGGPTRARRRGGGTKRHRLRVGPRLLQNPALSPGADGS